MGSLPLFSCTGVQQHDLQAEPALSLLVSECTQAQGVHANAGINSCEQLPMQVVKWIWILFSIQAVSAQRTSMISGSIGGGMGYQALQPR